MNRKKAFSLIEFMVALVITIILVGGFTMALNNITLGTRNATRTTDLTNLSRGVFKLMKSDIYSASKAMSDLNVYQFHENNTETGRNDVFAGISNLVRYDSGANSGTSEIELQWFDARRVYTDSDGNDILLPTHLSTMTWMVADFTSDSAVILSTLDDDIEMKNIAAGDYFLFYPSNPVFSFQDYDLQTLHDNVQADTGLYDEGTLNNGGWLMQVESGSAGAVPAPFDSCGEAEGYAMAFQFSFGGSTFAKDLGSNAPQVEFTTPSKPCVGRYFNEDGVPNNFFRAPKNCWLARKIGEKRDGFDSYRRVRYYLDKATRTLIRTSRAADGSDTDMILASNVEAFDIQIGLDVVDTTEDWDGAVRMEEPDYWISDYADLTGSANYSRAMVGRHALAVKITITFRSEKQDLQDTTGDQFKRRTFEQIINIKNSHLPMGSI
jgi:type II secretory pathway pseudopilin PulG